MPRSYERVEGRRRQTYVAGATRGAGTTWGHWVPLAVTVTLAAAGVAAWVWHERKEGDGGDEYDHPPPQPPGPGFDPAASGTYPGASYPTGASSSGGATFASSAYSTGRDASGVDDEGIVSKMSGALRRTPSPQQIIDGASRRVAAGVAAAGAAAGAALASIREETGSRGDFEDHTRWSEEADTQNGQRVSKAELRDAEAIAAAAAKGTKKSSSKKQKTVAIVVSAEPGSHIYEADAGYHEEENASILAHLVPATNSSTRVFVLIFDPTLKSHPLATPPSSPPRSQDSPSEATATKDSGRSQDKDKPLVSSSSNISETEATAGPASSSSPLFTRLYNQAVSLVPGGDATCVMPFTTPSGYVHMLRHLAPDTVYVQATTTLSGPNGSIMMDQLRAWVGQLVLVVGDESGHGGLVDSEEEGGAAAGAGADQALKWWADDDRIGLGKGVEVVEGLRIGEDWQRRVERRD